MKQGFIDLVRDYLQLNSHIGFADKITDISNEGKYYTVDYISVSHNAKNKADDKPNTVTVPTHDLLGFMYNKIK